MNCTMSWFSKNNVTGGTEILWDLFKQHLNTEHIDYERVSNVLSSNLGQGFPQYIKLGFPEVEGTLLIEEYYKQLEEIEVPEHLIKNSMQLPFYKAKADTTCLVQDLHKYAAEKLYKLGYYDIFANNRVCKIFHEFQIKSMENSNRIVYVSDFAASQYPNHPGTVIPHGLDTSIFKPYSPEKKLELRKMLGIAPDKKVGLWVGRFHPQKGYHIMTNLAKKFKDVQWVFAFMDSMADREPYAKNVMFTKPLKYIDMPRLYNIADFFVLPSLCESFGLASLEAAACGVPVVHSNTGWLWNRDFKGGVVVKDWETSAYADAIDRVLKEKFEPRKEAEEFTITKWIQNWKKML